MVSIIILSYNTKELLSNCLNSIFATIKSDCEVIVVDNNSTDESVAMVKNDFKHVHLIENKENAGFAKGCNIGAAAAEGEYLLFLNSDTVLEEDVLIKMTEQLQKESVGVVGGLLLNTDKTYQRSFGSFYTLPRIAKMLFLGEKSELSGQNFSKTQPVDWVSGGFMMVQKKVFESVGGFDEGYFMYVEDVDICYRIKKLGYTILFDPHARVLHMGQGSSNRTFAVVHIYKGLSRFYKQHRSGVEYRGLLTLLRSKAYLVVLFGTIKNDRKLVARYKEAVSVL